MTPTAGWPPGGQENRGAWSVQIKSESWAERKSLAKQLDISDLQGGDESWR
jgi:hypothetical protein